MDVWTVSFKCIVIHGSRPEKFGMAVRSVGTLTRRHLEVRTPLKAKLKASEDATDASLTISTGDDKNSSSGIII